MAYFSSTALAPTSDLFRGRQAELDRLMHLCQEEVTSYVVLYGGRQNGKTSLLVRLEDRLAAAANVCRVDFQIVKDAQPKQAFAFLAAELATKLPLFGERSPVSDGPQLLSFLSQALARPEVQRLVLLLDEFGALPTPTREVLGNALRSIFHARLAWPSLMKLQIVFSGGVELYDLVITEASSLHNICEEVYLGDLAQPDAVALVAHGLVKLGIADDMASSLALAVYQEVAGQPYLTQKIGGLLEQYSRLGVQFGPDVVTQATARLLQGDPLLRRIRDDLARHSLEAAACRLLTQPPRFTRLNDDMARLELIGLAKQDGDRWAVRNALLARFFGDLLGVGVSSVLHAEPVRSEPSPPHAGPVVEPVHHDPPHPRPSWVPEMIQVPAGPFLMGSSDDDEMAQADEKPQHRLILPGYWIGKTLVTNAQFSSFVESDGYMNYTYWTEVGWEWCQVRKLKQPEYWNDDARNGASYPVVGISWFEAVAYCRWLSACTGDDYRLPTEAEWEKAARGPNGWIWPWGNQWEPGRCNSEEIGKHRTTPINAYPQGVSPYGALDMAGNVWEWCVTPNGKPYPYTVEDEWWEDSLEQDVNRRLRGGAFWVNLTKVRCAIRNVNNPRARYYLSGLRVASHTEF